MSTLTAVTPPFAPAHTIGMSNPICPDDAAVIVEETATGRYAIRFRPILSHRGLERAFPAAWQALEYAELLHMEFGWPVIDRTEVA